MLRKATIRDLDALVALENRSFETDRLSRRSFRHLLTKANAVTLIAEEQGALAGYVTVLFNAGTSLARLYSIAVDERFKGHGLGRELVSAAEQAALDGECVVLRLEVRRDNEASLALFRRLGYREFDTLRDYYEDHMEALRFEKALAPHLSPAIARVPYYRQTLDFTCGPASLLMAMHSLAPDIALQRTLEIQLWRESTTVFMTSGHGGCGPHGMALAAWHRGFAVEMFLSEAGALFIDSVRSEEKKEVMTLVQQQFAQEVAEVGIPVHYRQLTLEEMRKGFDRGGIPLVLISSWRIYREKFPHWVVVTGFDERYVYVHDPYVDEEKGKSETDCMNMPILQKDFARMARYGRSGLRAALIIYNRNGELR
ncbi:MAG: GNAT family N-acetyltransferase/peptidase C39 family protein [Gammaproteobacteria bacterium]|nr:GNAT family N-acetyltransferase/peptidase C39 family protein [Gammaproteobacteria bacterium]